MLYQPEAGRGLEMIHPELRMTQKWAKIWPFFRAFDLEENRARFLKVVKVVRLKVVKVATKKSDPRKS
jgi:hypothetical protein